LRAEPEAERPEIGRFSDQLIPEAERPEIGRFSDQLIPEAGRPEIGRFSDQLIPEAKLEMADGPGGVASPPQAEAGQE